MRKLGLLTFLLFSSNVFVSAHAQTARKPELYVQTGHTSLLDKIVISPAGRFAASQDYIDRNVIKIWSIKDGKELRTLRHSDSVDDIVFSFDEGFVFTASGPAKITKWNVETGEEVESLKCDGFIIRLSPDARFALCQGNTLSGRTNSLWEVATKKVLWSFPSKGSGLRLSPDWKRLYVRSDNSLKVVDVDSGKELTEFSGYKDLDFEILDNGTWLLLYLPKGQRTLWNTNTGEKIALPAPSKPEDTVRTDSSGKYLFFTNEHKTAAEVFSLDDLTKRLQIDLTSGAPICSVDFADDKQSLIVAETGGIIRQLSLSDGKEIKRLVTGGSIQQNDIPTFGTNGFRGYFPDCEVTLYSQSNLIAFPRPNSWISVWDWGKQNEINTFGGFSRRQNVVAFSPDGTFLATGGVGDGTITLFPLTGSSTVNYLTGHKNAIYAITYNADGTRLASADIRGIIKLWDVRTGKELRQYDAGHWVWDIAFNPNGSLLASADESGWIKVWQVNESKQQMSFKASYTLATAVTFSPDGSNLLTGDVNGECDLWSATTGKHIRSFRLDSVTMLDAVAFSNDGKFVVAASMTKTPSTDRYPSAWLTPSLIKDRKGKLRPVFRKMFKNAATQVYPDKEDPVEDAMNAKTSAERRKGKNEFIYVWEIATGKLTKSIERRGVETMTNMDVTPLSITVDQNPRVMRTEGEEQNGVKFVVGKDITYYPLTEGNERYEFEAMRQIMLTASTLFKNVSRDGRFVVNKSVSGTLEMFDFSTDKRLCTLVPLIEDQWAIVTPEGRFDANELDNARGLYWFVRDVSQTPLSFEVFMRDYFEPRLLPRLLKCVRAGDCGQEFKDVRDLSLLNRTQPGIKITGIKPAKETPGIVDVSVDVNDVVSTNQKDPPGRPLTSGVYDVRLFRDGQLIGHSTSDERLRTTFRAYGNFSKELSVWREATRVGLINGKKTFIFKVRLPRNPPNGKIEFSAYAFNEDRVKSETARATYSILASDTHQSAPRRAYLITFGVNSYDNPKWDLQFAANDATAMREIVSARLQQRKEFVEVIKISLISDNSTSSNDRKSYQREATKSNIQSVFELLAGKTPALRQLKLLERAVGAETLRKIRRTNPDDMVLVSFSSHGYADKNGVFYILPADIGKDSGRTVTSELLRRSISSDELSLWLRDVDAREMVMIVDACHAASAVEGNEFKPAPMGSRGLGQLAFDKGMKILTATQAANAAIEAGGSIGHGLLTFALLREGLENNKADFRITDRIINLKEWLEYGEFRVPGMYEELASGKLKSIGKARAELFGEGEMKKQTLSQQPSLFDFAPKRSQTVLVQLP